MKDDKDEKRLEQSRLSCRSSGCCPGYDLHAEFLRLLANRSRPITIQDEEREPAGLGAA